MNRKAVSSTIVARIGYHAESAVLEVEFLSGAVYHYFDVLELVYTGLISAPSTTG